MAKIVNNPLIIKLNSFFKNCWVRVKSNRGALGTISLSNFFKRNLYAAPLELDAIELTLLGDFRNHMG
ncbi:hypothetical protein D3C73_1010650 [compost metagenome]